MKSPYTGFEAQAHRHTSSSNTQAESPRDLLDALATGIAKTAARESQPEALLPVSTIPAEPSRELLTEKMLADRWMCSVARLQRWRTVGQGPPYLKIVGKVLYRVKDIEAYEEASLVSRML